MKFDRVITVDWSGGNDRGKTPTKDAIWAAIGTGGTAQDPIYLRNRQVAERWLVDTLTDKACAYWSPSIYALPTPRGSPHI